MKTTTQAKAIEISLENIGFIQRVKFAFMIVFKKSASLKQVEVNILTKEQQ